ALPRAFAMGGDRAPVQGHEPLHHREPDTQAALRPVEAAIALHEDVEDLRDELGAHSHPVVPHAQDRLVALTPSLYPHLPALRRVFGGVAQEIEDDLDEPGGIPEDRSAFALEVDLELLTPVLVQGPRRFHGAGDDDAEVDRLA